MALRSVHLTADLQWLPDILLPLSTCKPLAHLTIQVSPYMLRRCNPDLFAPSLRALAQGRTSLCITFLCQLDSDHWKRGEIAGPPLDRMRDWLASELEDLWHRGMLRFMRHVRNSESQMSELDDVEEF